ncbi:MAG: hypothetical protein P8Y44_14000, partial [Acidobacteriota bacterium]
MSFEQSKATRYAVSRAAILPIAAHAAFLGLYDLQRNLAWTLLIATVGFIGVISAEKRLRRAEPLTIGSILWVGLLLRLLVLPIEPSLSNDVYRYLWDGNVVAQGFNPYLLPPEDPALESIRGDLWP